MTEALESAIIGAVSGFVGVIVGAIIPMIQSSLASGAERKKSARYLAIRLVCLFDKFMEDCVTVVHDEGVPEPDGRMLPRETTPDSPAFPGDLDWKSIDHDLMYDILSFPSDVKDAEGCISYIWREIADPPDYDEFYEERAFRYSKLGLQAQNVAKKLRGAYDIREKNYEDWDPVSSLEKRLKEIERRRDLRAERNAEMMKTMAEKVDGN